MFSAVHTARSRGSTAASRESSRTRSFEFETSVEPQGMRRQAALLASALTGICGTAFAAQPLAGGA